MVQPYALPIGKGNIAEAICRNTPHSNTGVVKPVLGARPDNAWLVFGSAHRPEKQWVKGLNGVENQVEIWHNFAIRLFRTIKRHLVGQIKGITISEPSRGKNFYDKAIYMCVGGSELASIHYDGERQKGTFLLILTGRLCSYLPPEFWRFLERCALRFQAKLNRFDLAVDDYQGTVFDLIEIEYLARTKAELFRPIYRMGRGPLPGFKKIEDDGAITLYIGSKDSTVQVCAYEKGKESKATWTARQNPNWVRYEVRFKRKKSELDLALLNPDNWLPAVLGTSTYLGSKLQGMGDKFTSNPETLHGDALDSLVNALLTLRKQYGPIISRAWYALGSEGLLEALARGGDTSAESVGPADAPEIRRRLASDTEGRWRSSALVADALADSVDW